MFSTQNPVHTQELRVPEQTTKTCTKHSKYTSVTENFGLTIYIVPQGIIKIISYMTNISKKNKNSYFQIPESHIPKDRKADTLMKKVKRAWTCFMMALLFRIHFRTQTPQEINSMRIKSQRMKKPIQPSKNSGAGNVAQLVSTCTA